MFLKFANIQSISASTMTYGAIKSSKEQSGNVVHSISYFFIKHSGIIRVQSWQFFKCFELEAFHKLQM